jgi:hypothetical protein
MISKKRVRESRGRRALGLVVIFFVATIFVCALHPLGHTQLGTIRIVYGGTSALLVTLVLFFGVGSWSRFLPQDGVEVKVEGGRDDNQPSDKVKTEPHRETLPTSPDPQNPQEGGQGHAPTS